MNKILLGLTLLLLSGAPFSESHYKAHSWDIFLYLCEKTNDCLDGSAGWAKAGTISYEKHTCYVRRSGESTPSITVTDIELLLNIFASCRAGNLSVFEKYKGE